MPMNREIQNWVLTFQDYEPMACIAPCSLYSVLLERQLIKDPYYGLNEEEVRDFITSDKAVRLTAKTEYRAEELRKQVKLQSVYDIGVV